MSKVVLVLCGAIAFYCGWQMLSSETAEKNHLQAISLYHSMSWRDPAALHGFPQAKPKLQPLSDSEKKRILAALTFKKSDGLVGIQVPQFITKSVAGGAGTACQHFDRLVFEFSGEGVAEAGQIPSLKVDGNCEQLGSQSQIREILVPFKKLNELPAERLVDFFFEKEQVYITIENASFALPKEWILRSVQFYRRGDKSQVLKLEPTLKEIQKSALIMSWKN